MPLILFFILPCFLFIYSQLIGGLEETERNCLNICDTSERNFSDLVEQAAFKFD